MSETTTIEIELPTLQAKLVQAAADAQGRTVSDLLASGQGVQGIVNDQLNQANWRLMNKGVYASELVAEAESEAARQVSARKANTPIPAGK